MRNMKKILAFVMAMMMVLSMGIVTASAETTDQTIYFEVPEIWGDYGSVFCHIWPLGGDALAQWQSKKEKCVETDTEGLFSYDVSKVGGLQDGVSYGVIFSENSMGNQTYDAIMSTECLGDTLYVDTTIIYENPQDSNKTCLGAFWRNQDPTLYGPLKQVTSIGTVVGTAIPQGKNNANLLIDFVDGGNLMNAVTILGIPAEEILISVIINLNMTEEELQQVAEYYGLNDSSDDEPTTDEIGLLGDANMDEKVNVKDATYIQKAIADLVTMNENEKYLADVDGNLTVNIKDATAIQKHLVGIETGYQIGIMI